MQIVDRAHGTGEASCIAVRFCGQVCLLSVVLLLRPSPAWTTPAFPCLPVRINQVAHRSDIMATGGTDNTVRVWDVRMGKLLQEGVGHSAKVTGLQFSPDDKQLVSVGDDGCVFVWNVYT